jgi:hypothetical protein
LPGIGGKRLGSISAVLALALCAGFGPMASDGTAAAACSWEKRSKRIVNRVVRHGTPRRLVKVKRWRVCVPQPSAVATPAPDPVPAPAPGPIPPDAGPAPPPEPRLERLGVRALDEEDEAWSFTLSRPSLAAREAIVELNNESGDPHNLNLQREGGEEPVLAVSEAGPEERRSGRFTLLPGTYRLWCSLPTHEERGMSATLVVAGG